MNDEHTQQLDGLRENEARLQQKVSKLMTLNEQLEKLMGAKQADFDQQLEKFNCLEADLEDARQEIEGFKTQVAQMEAERDQAKATYDKFCERVAAERKDAEEKFQKEIESLKKEREKVESDHEASLSQLQAELQQMACLLEQKHTELEEAQVSFGTLQKEKEATVSNLEDQLEKKCEELQQKETQFEDMEKENQTTVSRLEDQLEKKCEELQQKETQFEDMEKENQTTVSRLEDQLEKKCEELQQKETQFEDMEKENQTTVSTLEDQLEKKCEELQQKETQFEDMEKENQTTVSTLEEQLQKQNEELQQAQRRFKEVMELEGLMSLRKAEIERLQSTLNQQTVRRSESQARETQLQSELLSQQQSYESQLHKLSRKVATLTVENKTFQEQHEVRSEQAAVYRAELSSLKQQLAAVEEEKRQLEEAHKEEENRSQASLQREISRLQNQLEAEFRKNESTSQMVKEFGDQIKRYERQCQQYEAKRQQMEDRLHLFNEKEVQWKADGEKVKELTEQLQKLETAKPKTKPPSDTKVSPDTDTIFNDSLDSGPKNLRHNLRSQTLHDFDGSFTNTLPQTPGEAERKMLSKFDPDASSYSQKSGRYSMYSVGSTKSNTFVPTGAGRMFSCEDEPPESPQFEWGRLNELQRRNTLCLPHMKSSYPVETQVVKTKNFSDNAMQRAQLADAAGRQDSTSRASTSTASRKRKPETVEVEAGPVLQVSTDAPDGKQARSGPPANQKPGPPTPSKDRSRHVSGNSKKSPWKQSRTPRRSPRRSPRFRSTPHADAENVTQDPRRQSIAFSVGFSPVKAGGLRRLTRQKAFISGSKDEYQKQQQKSKETAASASQNFSTPPVQKSTNVGSSKPQSTASKVNRLIEKFEGLTPVKFILNPIKKTGRLSFGTPNKVHPGAFEMDI
ncbi:hypothetical protein BaRGS_00023157 [Batillaria attramentaria]|uniref:Uncharacterized protein n=1 Tax=Batillaria attramentaria TaxID=370345 RepID=A0ABD0KF15_9CAEN